MALPQMSQLRKLISQIPDYVGGVDFREPRHSLGTCDSPEECHAVFLKISEDLYESAKGDERVSNLRKALLIPLKYSSFPGYWGAN
jgi:hypothetical protein